MSRPPLPRTFATSIVACAIFAACCLTALGVVGCSPMGVDPDGAARLVQPPAPPTTGRASLSFKIKLDEAGGEHLDLLPSVRRSDPAARAGARTAVRADATDTGTRVTTGTETGLKTDTTGQTTVRFRLTGIHPGLATTTVTEQTVAVTDGSAEVRFDQVPAVPTLAQIQINNGSLFGFYDYHGAKDLQPGANVIVVNPMASGLKQDAVAAAVQKVADSGDLLDVARPTLVDDIKGIVNTFSLANNPAADGKIQDAVVDLLRPPAAAKLVIASDNATLRAARGTSQLWAKTIPEWFTAGQFWTWPIEEVAFEDVLRQGLDGVALVGAIHSTRVPFAVVHVDPATGEKVGAVRNRGLCWPVYMFEDRSVVIGGTHKDANCPLLFRWSGQGNALTQPGADGGTTGLLWQRFFTDLPGSEGDQYPGVLTIRYDGDGKLVVGVRDSQRNTRKFYRLDAATGAQIGDPFEFATSNQAPEITLTAPTAGAQFNQGTPITFTADARDWDGQIVRVAYYANGEFVGASSMGPFTYVWNTAYPATYEIVAKAIDNLGGVRSTAPITITVKAAAVSTTRIRSVVAGWGGHILALAEDGSVWGWGSNERGQLQGTIDDPSFLTPMRMTLPEGRVVKIGTLFCQSFAVYEDGSVYGWGGLRAQSPGVWDSWTHTAVRYNFPIQDATVATPVTVPAGYSIEFVGDWDCALFDASGLRVPNPAGTSNRNPLVAVDGAIQKVVYNSNMTGMLVLLRDGTVLAGPETGLTAVTGLAGVTDAAVLGGENYVARLGNGETWVWGLNAANELADGTTTRRRTPIRNDRLDGFTTFASSGSKPYALKADGTVWTWGPANEGWLPSTSTPTQVPLLADIVALWGGNGTLFAGKRDGSLYAIGQQTGDGTGQTSTIPVRVPFP